MLRGLQQPIRDHDTAEFWAGCDEGQLRLQACADCGQYRWPPGPVCGACGSMSSTWQESPGAGVVFSWVVVHVPLVPALADQLPYTVGLIELDEGIRIVSTIDGCAPDDIHAGMPVQISFDNPGDPVFTARPVTGHIGVTSQHEGVK
ncbi:Zn-ribbon domain-containing OB-fold protein [Rhodococcus sp. NPDC057529]|uniref:Zn-ribbon domain-containing OB-fold protein n=1 Tax=Rhodococcus sp. NPDC057529 TaxID=3346158 RepID=UPI003671BEB1